MPELPWRKFYHHDWRGDKQLGRCSPATRGIWIDAITAMMSDRTDRISGTDEELARDCRCSILDIQNAHNELQKTGAADVSMQNGCKTWVCRKLSRELRISEIRANSASSRWSKGNAKTMQDPMQVHHASSACASASIINSLEGESEGKHFPEVVGRPTLDEVKAWAEMMGLAEWKAVDWFHEMEGCGWLDFAHRPIRDARAVLARVNSKWVADGRPMSPPASRFKDKKTGKGPNI